MLFFAQRTGGTVNRNFTQTMTVHCDDAQKLIEMATQWDEQQANADIMGYMGMRLLADRQAPGRYVMVADFGVIDPDVSAAEEALRNNERPETQVSNQRLHAIINGEIEYREYDELYRTDR